MENNSNRNGRALEFAIVDNLLKKISNSVPLNNTQSYQERDQNKFNELSDSQKIYFNTSADSILSWLERKVDLNSQSISIERMSDDSSKKGDVTDIRIILSNNIINLSIKHNHLALKHQRPSALAIQCGFAKKSPEDSKYRHFYETTTKDFLNRSMLLKNDAINFSDIIGVQPDFINKQLYNPVCNLVCNFLNTHVANSPRNAEHFFSFIKGTTDFYKINVSHKKIDIYEFALLPPVTSLHAKIKGDSYVDVSFSNDWVISMRLHTASSRIEGISLKFDSQLLNMVVPKESIKI
jgi:hypothetical protein